MKDDEVTADSKWLPAGRDIFVSFIAQLMYLAGIWCGAMTHFSHHVHRMHCHISAPLTLRHVPDTKDLSSWIEPQS